jgi:type II secretory pathway pseudopilin PulG
VRLGVLGALAVGYVLGSRAGRERYEQIRQAASRAAERLESYGSSGSLATSPGRGQNRDGAGARREG